MQALTTIIFSRSRALQCEGTLSSLALHARNRTGPLYVLFKATDQRDADQYATVAREHPEATFVAETDFSQDLWRLLKAEYALFLVDDALCVREFDLAEAVRVLESDQTVYAVNYGLGTNTTYSYPGVRDQAVPFMLKRANRTPPKLWRYYWPSADTDFGYPTQISYSVFQVQRRGDIPSRILHLWDFEPVTCPNNFEHRLWKSSAYFKRWLPNLVIPEMSCVFCNPLNIVTNYCRNRAGSDPELTAEALRDRFDAGERIDVERYMGLVTRSALEEQPLWTRKV